ncbi:hypothetical protein [Pimelobacter sp. 30-1]|uniref:hypothetical protein n=1 Tax=Pimelobacter sp. 30-1 TaxID=2004991 RepID=UPI001C04D539|nr:hypothetical protein [Pimelobacter sp. 30-1]MBU2693853.1 hypothetical protein [Pimelobacter sp. 30-1]
MNEHEAQRIACAISRARPDWPERQVRTLIETRLLDRPRRDVFVALAWVASERTSASPYRVLEAGPWWQAAAVDGTTSPRQPFTTATACDVCSQPAQRHTAHSGHEFVSVADAARARTDDPKPRLPRTKEIS